MSPAHSRSSRPSRATDLRERDVVETIHSAENRFRRCYDLVRASSYLRTLDEHLVAHTGRPRTVSWLAWCVLMQLVAEHTRGRIVLTDAVRLAAGLTDEQRAMLGLDGVEIAYHHIEGNLTDLATAMEARVDRRTGEIGSQRLPCALGEVTSLIASSTIPAEFRGFSPAVAVDSTDTECWARRRSRGAVPDVDPAGLSEDAAAGTVVVGKKRGRSRGIRSYAAGFPKLGADGRLRHSVDPDAREGYRSGKNGAKKDVFLGFDLHTACLTHAEGSAYPMPALIAAAVLAPAGSEKATPGLEAVALASRVAGTTHKVLADRGYTYLSAARWAGPLADRGISQTFDLHRSQYRTAPGPRPGTVFVDGALFVDALPEHLRSLPTLGPSQRTKAEIHQRYQQRAPYAFTAMGWIRPGSRKQRFRGPALTGALRCPNHAPSMRRDPAIVPTTSCPTVGCACATTVTLTERDLLRERQPRQFGTANWAQDYHRRKQVESGNADLKTHNVQITRGSMRVRGLAKHSILVAFLIAVSNRLRADAHLARYGPPVRDRRARRVNNRRRTPAQVGSASSEPVSTPPKVHRSRPPPDAAAPETSPAADEAPATTSQWLPLNQPPA